MINVDPNVLKGVEQGVGAYHEEPDTYEGILSRKQAMDFTVTSHALYADCEVARVEMEADFLGRLARIEPRQVLDCLGGVEAALDKMNPSATRLLLDLIRRNEDLI